jgi:hypothetical protein
MHRGTSPIVGFLALLLGACGPREESYFPLNPGRTWEYDLDIQTMDGLQHRRHVVENLPAVKSDQQRWVPRRKGDNSISYFLKDAQGISRVAERSAEGALVTLPVPEPILRYPLTASAKWSGKGRTVTLERKTPPELVSLTKIDVEMDMQYSVTDTDAVVMVPAGRFAHCLVVKGSGAASRDVGFYIGQTDLSIESTEWYAPDVGLVKAVCTETTTDSSIPHGEYALQLTAYHR